MESFGKYPLILSYHFWPLRRAPFYIPPLISKLIFLPAYINIPSSDRIKLVEEVNRRIPQGDLYWLYPSDSFLINESSDSNSFSRYENYYKTIVNYENLGSDYSKYEIIETKKDFLGFYKPPKEFFTKKDFEIVIEDILNPLIDLYPSENYKQIKEELMLLV